MIEAISTAFDALSDVALGPLVTLVVVVDPIAILPIFIALTAGYSAAERRRVAARALIVAGGVLAVFGLAGEAVLGAIGVGLPAFRISGGVMLFLIALEMLFEKRTERRNRAATAGASDDAAAAAAEDDARADPTVFPLATPLLAGPGAMASMILLTAGAENTVAEVAVYLCLALVLAATFGMFLIAGAVERALGPTGVNLATRLFGVLLGALAVQFVLDGLADFGFVSAGGR